MKNSAFTLPKVYLYSLILAGADTLVFGESEGATYSLETFSLRALTIFTIWLLIRLAAERAERRGKSYSQVMIATICIIVVVGILVAM